MSKSSNKRSGSVIAEAYTHDEYSDVPVAMAVGAHSPEDMTKHKISSTHQSGAHTHGVKHWPPSLKDQIVSTFKTAADEHKGKSLLDLFAWPNGLQQSVFKSCKKIPLRFFIIDDSGIALSFSI
jgi:hypothetical protein